MVWPLRIRLLASALRHLLAGVVVASASIVAISAAVEPAGAATFEQRQLVPSPIDLDPGGVAVSPDGAL